MTKVGPVLQKVTTSTPPPPSVTSVQAKASPVALSPQDDTYQGPITRARTSSVATLALPSPQPASPVTPILLAPPSPARKLLLERPLVAFDLETTGLSRERDAIIEWGAVKEWPNGDRKEYNYRIHPRVPVQPSAERIHGVSNAALANEPPFAKVGPQIAEIMRNCDILGHNARAFDIPFLRIELKRLGLETALDGAHVVDTLQVFRKAVPKGTGEGQTENHRLATAYRYYFHKPLDGAHGALADARASLDVLHAQVEKHPALPNTVKGLESVEHNA